MNGCFLTLNGMEFQILAHDIWKIFDIVKWKISVNEVYILTLMWFNAHEQRKVIWKILWSSAEGFAYSVDALV